MKTRPAGPDIEKINSIIVEAMQDPEYRQALYRGQCSIKIDTEGLALGRKNRNIYPTAKKYGLSVHTENNITYLYMDV